jgi:hypothetical protein
MALQFTIFVSTPMTDEAFAQLVAKIVGTKGDIHKEPGDAPNPVFTVDFSGDFEAYIYKLLDRWSPDNQINLDPNMCVDFNLQPSNYVRLRDMIFQMVLQLLKAIDDDLVWVAEDAEILLLRKSGELLISKGKEYWTSDRLKAIRLPYKVVDIPDL